MRLKRFTQLCAVCTLSRTLINNDRQTAMQVFDGMSLLKEWSTDINVGTLA